jgi:hypothetical protein
MTRRTRTRAVVRLPWIHTVVLAYFSLAAGAVAAEERSSEETLAPTSYNTAAVVPTLSPVPSMAPSFMFVENNATAESEDPYVEAVLSLQPRVTVVRSLPAFHGIASISNPRYVLVGGGLGAAAAATTFFSCVVFSIDAGREVFSLSLVRLFRQC